MPDVGRRLKATRQTACSTPIAHLSSTEQIFTPCPFPLAFLSELSLLTAGLGRSVGGRQAFATGWLKSSQQGVILKP
jgi:hypothetical protein